MSVLFQTFINTGKIYPFRKVLSNSLCSYKCIFTRKFSDVPKKFTTFDEVVGQRRAEARRSLVVQVNSDSSFNELYSYCSKYAEINGIHHYKNSSGQHFMLIEFQTEDNLKDVLRSCSSHQKDVDVMSLRSPFLWFRAATGKKESITSSSKSLMTKEGTFGVNDDVLIMELANCETVSDQIQLLYDRTILNDLGIRLRYMVARQLEVVFESLYANIAVRPFGSSVNGFGSMGCDLDLVLTDNLTNEMTDPQKRLVFQEKKCDSGRSLWQRHIEVVGDLLELRVPGATRVQRILHARVPIVKYTHDFADVDCDLCYNNMSGVRMSALVWAAGVLDARVGPLARAARRWARAAALTHAHPGRWITNFPLTLMVLFFLQQRRALLPPFDYLLGRTDKNDTRITEEDENCTSLRDINQIPKETYGQNPANLETLLLQFFEFYSQFDFQEKAISLNRGVPVRKPNSLPLYIVNPLEQSLNVSRNVSYEECERLKMELRDAAWHLESSLGGKRGDDWGLLGLVEKRTTREFKKLLRVGNSHRLVSVKDLFKDDEESENSKDGLKNKLERLTQKSDKEIEESVKEMKASTVKEGKKEKVKFKNSQVAREVYRIQRNKIV